MTNYERIHGMNQDQLAAFLAKIAVDGLWLDNVCRKVCSKCENYDGETCRHDLETYSCKYVESDLLMFDRWMELECEA